MISVKSQGPEFKFSRFILKELRYHGVMSDFARSQKWLPLTALMLAGTLFTVTVFLGWLHYGSDIFLSLIESGLAYCF
ncbi:hypothetical protein IP85_21530 [Rhizobium sp. AAP116]|nr:hypothetical protein IP85_21530 [Rhizobium sp. AAP116]